MLDLSNFIKALFPKGALWIPKEGGNLDKFIDGLASSLGDVYSYLGNLAKIRDPSVTEILSDLEREYGIIVNSELTEAERRAALDAVAYRARGDGSADFLQAQLRRAGFTNAYVYQNDPAIDPDIYLEGDYACVAGGSIAIAGNDDAFAGWRDGAGGFLIVNGDLVVSTLPEFLAQLNGDSTFAGNDQAVAGYFETEQVLYGGFAVPATSELWHLIFFVGGVKGGAIYAPINFLDPDMELSGVTNWPVFQEGVAGASSKTTSSPHGGSQALIFGPNRNYTRQDVSFNDVVQDDILFSGHMHAGGAKVYDRSEEQDDADMSGSPTTLPGYDALVFNGTTQYVDAIADSDPVTDTGTLSAWVKWAAFDWSDWFNLPFTASGSSELEDEYTVNSATQAAFARWVGNDASASDWVDQISSYDLDITGGGTDPTLNYPAPGIGDYGVRGYGSEDYYQEASAAGAAAIGTEDFIIEGIAIDRDSTSTSFIFSNLASSMSGAGWQVYIQSGTFRFRMRDGSTLKTVSCGTAIPQDEWFHFLICGDRSDASASGCQIFINGVKDAGVDISGASSSLNSTDKATLLASVGGAANINGALSFFQVAKKAAWFAGGATNDTDFQALATERFYECCGVYPTVAGAQAAPSTATRASGAYIDQHIGSKRVLAPVGDDWIRVCKRPDVNSDYLTGCLIEEAITNEIPDSQDLSAFTTKVNCTIDSASAVAPDGETVGDGIVPNVSQTACRVNHAVALVGTKDVTVSGWFKKGYEDWVKLEDAFVSNGGVWFDLANGVVGTVEAGVDYAGIEDWGDGWFRCWVRAENSSGTFWQYRITPAGSDGSAAIGAGDGSSVVTYAFGMQLELDRTNYHPGSYVYTSGGSGTKAADDLTYVGAANCGSAARQQGNMRCKFLVDDETISGVNIVADLHDSANNPREYLSIESSSNVAIIQDAIATGLDLVKDTTIDVRDGVIHGVAGGWRDYNLAVAVDDSRNVAENEIHQNPPNDLDEITIGAFGFGASYLNGLVSAFAISYYGWTLPRPIIATDVQEVMLGIVGGFLDPTKNFFTGTVGEVQVNGRSVDMIDDTGFSADAHGALMWDGSDQFLFTDSAQTGTASQATDPSTTSECRVALAYIDTHTIRFGGAIGNVRVFSEARDLAWATEMTSRGFPTHDTDLVSRYSVLEDGTTLRDFYSNLSFTTHTVANEWTELGKALLFNPTATSYADESAGHSAFNSSETTINLFAKFLSNIPTEQGIVSYGDVTDTNQRWLTYEGGLIKWKVTADDDSQHEIQAAVSLNRLCMITAICYDSGADFVMELWIDGVKISDDTISSLNLKLSAAEKIYLGTHYDAGPTNCLNGMLQDIQFFDAQKVQAEIEDLYDEAMVIIENGCYVEQSITPTTSPTKGIGYMFADSFRQAPVSKEWQTVPVVLYQEVSGGDWRAFWVGQEANRMTDWQEFEEIASNGIYAIRFYSKFCEYGYCKMDDLDFVGVEGDRVSVLEIPADQREVFERTILRHKPLGTWCAAVVNFV